MNNITLIGNIGRDPETRQVGNNTVAKFSLATSRSYTNKQGEKVTDTSWHDIEAWGAQAEVIAKYCQKGHKLAVIGELRYDKYTNKDGQEVTRAKIVLQSLSFCSRVTGRQVRKSHKLSEPERPTAEEFASAAAGDDDDLPF
jgi:single-strand DNA-binding protein